MEPVELKKKDKIKVDIITIIITIIFGAINLFCLDSQGQEATAPIPETFDVTLQWDANTEPDLDHYNVHWGRESGNYNQESEDIPHPTTTAEIKNLTYGQTYYFAVTATDKEGLTSDYSNEVNTSGYDGLPPTAPGGTKFAGEITVHYSDGSTLTYTHMIQ